MKSKAKVINKAMLIERLAQETEEQKATCKRLFDTLIELIIAELKSGNQVAIAGFGAFDVKTRKARKGINPVTGKTMSIPAKRVPKFRAGKGLKEEIAL